MAIRWRCQSHFGGEAAQKFRFCTSACASAKYRNTFVSHFKPVANGAVSQQASRNCQIVQVVIEHWRAPVDYARRQQDCSRGDNLVTYPSEVIRAILLEGGDITLQKARTVADGLLAHAFEQLRPCDAPRESGLVAAAWDKGSAALSAINNCDVQMEAPQVKRGCQPGRTAADDQAIAIVSLKLLHSRAQSASRWGPDPGLGNLAPSASHAKLRHQLGLAGGKHDAKFF